MRTTLNMINRTTLTNLNQITSAMDRLNTQLSSGKDYSNITDNPNNLVTALGLRSSLSEIKQYQNNLIVGDNLLGTSENALTEIKWIMARARTLNIQAINASLSSDNLKSMAGEIKNIFEETVLLANSQLNGKYIFAGFRTTGYNDIEPVPFMTDKVDGYRINGSNLPMMTTKLTGIVTNTAIAAGDLEINGNAIGAINAGAVTNGLNMDKAANAKAAINAADPTVTATLTTLYAGGAATADAGGGSIISFDLNNVTLTISIPPATTAAGVASLVSTAVNSVTDQTGIEANIGDTTNGGGIDSIVLRNSRDGDEGAITIANLQEPGTAASGLANGVYSIAANPNMNTGAISLSSNVSFMLDTPAADDSILQELGLAGGAKGFGDEAGDGRLIYGYRLTDDELSINGQSVTGITTDGISDIYADISAAAKANAINAISDLTTVTAIVEPVSLTASQGVGAGTEKTALTGTVTNNAIAAGDLTINGINIGAINPGAVTNGLNMGKAANAKAAINAETAATGVTARLTTLTSGGAAAAGTSTTVSFTLNNVNISFNTNANPLSDAIYAINSVKEQTGVEALEGNGTNGAAAGQIILKNMLAGDEAPIVITGFNGGTGTAITGLANMNQGADATHNTGEITLFSSQSFTLNSPTISPPADSILNELGLGGGESVTGITSDNADDGILTHGSTPAYIRSGDLVINGVDIFSKTTAITGNDSTNTLLGAINGKTADTGIKASRNTNGLLILTAIDGRNLHIETSAVGERITHLTGASPTKPQSVVFFGAVKLVSDRIFSLSSTPTTNFEPGLAALGLAGGEATTNEEDDIAGDGKIDVKTIHMQTDNIRYTGDRANELSIKVGNRTTMGISQNGKETFMETGVFTALKKLENLLNGTNFTATEGNTTISDTTEPLGTEASGFAQYDELTSGSFTVTLTDNEAFPASARPYVIQFDPTVDTAESMAQKINGLPGLTATWTKDGNLEINSTDPNRFSFILDQDTGNFLKLVGISPEDNQAYGLGQTLSSLDQAIEALTTHIADFGARANRIQVQTTIYTSLELTSSKYLSEKEDTDITQAIMELKAKEVAYQAALAAAARTMQLSLVDYLR